MKIIRVTSFELPELQPYRTLRRPMEHRRQGIFIAESEKVVRQLLESRLHTISIMMTQEWFDHYKNMLEDKKDDQPTVFIAKKNLLESIVGYHLHQGIMAVGRIPQSITLEGVLTTSPRPFLLVAIEGMTNSENLGVLVRNCVAFGVQALIVGETSSSPYLRRAVRNSMGTIFKIPVVRVESLVKTLAVLRDQFGVRSLAAHPREQSKSLADALFGQDCCLVFGSEGEGLSKDVVAACDDAITIPMKTGVDSLNVASASAVLLYEVWRQRVGFSR